MSTNPEAPAPFTTAPTGISQDDPTHLESTPKRVTAADIWARRIFLITFVLLCTLLGVFLIVLPWRPEWTENPFLLGYPTIRAIFSNPFFRGLCSGFGVLDLWIAISETAHYHEDF